jgi:hypothetical protein
MRTRFSHVPLAARFVFALLLSALFAHLLAGCGGGGSTTTGIQPVNIINGANGLGGSTVNPAGDGTSGFKGTVSLIPSSTTSTTQAPLAGATILAQLPDGTIVGKATSDGSGNYTILLVPGTFQLTGQNVSANIVPVAPAQSYTIGQHAFTTINITYIDKSK